MFTVNATYSEFGPLSVQTWVEGNKSLREAAIESGDALTKHLKKNLGIEVTFDIDDTDYGNTKIQMADGREMDTMLDPKRPVTFVFHPTNSVPLSDLARTNAQNELIKEEMSYKVKGKSSPRPKVLALPSGTSPSISPELAKMFESLQQQLNQQKLKLDKLDERTERLVSQVASNKRRTDELRRELGIVSTAAAGDKEAVARLQFRALAPQSMKILTHQHGELLEEDEGVASWAGRIDFPHKNLIVDAVICAKGLGNPVAHMATADQIAEAIQFAPLDHVAGFQMLFKLCYGVEWNDQSVQAGTATFCGPRNTKAKEHDAGN